jgi:hypothetical protein
MNVRSLIKCLLPPFLGLLLFPCFLFVGVVLYDTVTYNPPFKTYGDSAEIIEYPQYTVFAYKRELSIEYDIYGMVDRYVMHGPSGRTIQLDSSGQIYKKAERRPVYREFRLPANLEKGEWCLYAYLKYRPGLSMKDHIFEAPRVCANVK